MESIFTDKNKTPDKNDLKMALGESNELWQIIVEYVFHKYPNGIEFWSYMKQSWFFRINDKKRAILYLLPRDRFFKAAFMFGQKATEKILESNISETIKEELKSARIYAEGRGIRLDVKDTSLINDIKTLIDIKLGS